MLMFAQRCTSWTPASVFRTRCSEDELATSGISHLPINHRTLTNQWMIQMVMGHSKPTYE